MGFYLTNAVAQGMLNGTGLAEAIGSGGKIRVYSGTPPANADAALSGNTQLAELGLSTPPFSGFSDTGSAGRATFGTITQDSSADATGTATTFRVLDAANVVKAQGEVGLSGSGKELIVGTVAFTAGSVVAISSGTIDLPEGPP